MIQNLVYYLNKNITEIVIKPTEEEYKRKKIIIIITNIPLTK